MILEMFRGGYRSLFEKDQTLSQFRDVLHAARRSPAYASTLESARFQTPEAIRAIEDVHDVLARLPFRDYRNLIGVEASFESASPRSRSQYKLFSPLATIPRTAVLAEGFKDNGRVRSFEDAESGPLEDFDPEAVAAPIRQLRELAGRVSRGETGFPRIAHSVTAFTGPRLGWHSEDDREIFWEAFRVPVFFQILGLGGELLAWECEAHEGLHIEKANALFEQVEPGETSELAYTSLVNVRQPALRVRTGVRGTVTGEPCACGRPGQRLKDLELPVLAGFENESVPAHRQRATTAAVPHWPAVPQPVASSNLL